MEKINKPPITDIPALKNLEEKWEQWGKELQDHQNSKGKRGQKFSWREGCDKDLRPLLHDLTQGHCSFCDGFPIGEVSLEPIEHYFPKAQFPLMAYQWENLFYCCDKCNSEANKTTFEYTLKPDDTDYTFSSYFYFDSDTGKITVLENLENSAPKKFNKANKFLQRYGINTPKRNMARIHLMNDIKNFHNNKNPSDSRKRKDFKYRYIFDYISRLKQTKATG